MKKSTPPAVQVASNGVRHSNPWAHDNLVNAAQTMDAITAGEVDAFVVSKDPSSARVLTLSDADRPYRMFVENMREGAATVSSDGFILYANWRLAELASRTRESLIGSSLTGLVAGGAAVEEQLLWLGSGSGGSTFEIDLVAGNGVSVPVLIGVSKLELDGDVLTCLTFTDLSAQKAQDRIIARLSHSQGEQLVELQDAQASLTRQATHDGLTGLANRALLIDRINQSLWQAQRSEHLTAVIYVDLDCFKEVNDSHGHAAGDQVLRWVAGRLTALVRPMDTVARLGGDEFAILLPDIDSRVHAVDIGLRIVAELRRSREPLVGGERISASVGVAVSVSGGGSAETLLHEADTAMYKAKTHGGDRAEAFDADLGREVEARTAARHALQSALAEGRIGLRFQPIIDLTDLHLAGFEALVRIEALDGEVVLPSAFISVAEDSGLIIPLGTEVLRLACRQASSWRSVEGGPRLTVAINLSARQFEPGDLVSLVQHEIDDNGVDPTCVHFELTETAIINLRPDVIEQLGRLREYGVELGLDDFGTGYASLTHLRRLPVTFVKIDRSFVQGLGCNREDDRIVASMVDLAFSLGLRSIGEGVETIPQLERLREFGCDQAQGYLFAQPLAARDVSAAINRTDWRDCWNSG